MRFIRYITKDAVLAGVLGQDDYVFPLDGDASLSDLIKSGSDMLHEVGSRALKNSASIGHYDDLCIASPLETPPAVRDFYAFEGHVRAGRASRNLDMDPQWYEAPVFYFSNPYAIQGPGDVPMAPGTAQFDFELEVAAVLGGGGSNLSPAQGENLIVGYCVMNDWSARDIQKDEMRLSLGPVKGKDTATSVGPVLVTKDELEDRREGSGFDLGMSCRVNGQLYTQSSWSEIHWSFGEMISYASRGTEVRPNDVIGSGTANGGCILELSRRPGGEKYPWLKPQDVIAAEVELLGTLKSRIVTSDKIVPLRIDSEESGYRPER